MTRWRRVSPWCYRATVEGVTVRAWLSSDGVTWRAGYVGGDGRQVTVQDVSRDFVCSDSVFATKSEARRAAATVARKVASMVRYVRETAEAREVALAKLATWAVS